jgi:glycosyltransferase involved in cell wall biosynthesis
MNIVHVETGRHFYGGAQQVIYLMQGLRERGVEGLLVCVPGSGIDRIARDLGLPVSNIPCAGDLDLRFAWRLRQLLTESTPDIVHCHSRRGADFLGGQAAEMAGVPAIVSRRVDNTESPFWAGLRYRRFRRVIAISETIAEVLKLADVDQARLEVIRSAVDIDGVNCKPDTAAFMHEFDLPADAIVLGAIGQLIPRKGHRYLLEALAGLVSERPNLRLLIFGEGPLEAELKSLVSSLELEGKVLFAGFRDDLDEMIACLDLVVHPALAEGLGVALLKAAAAAVPVVAFDAGGVREAVSDGVTGLLVAPKDVLALRDAISTLIDDGSKRERFGVSGRERMQKEFSVDAMVDKHVTLYRNVCNGQD